MDDLCFLDLRGDPRFAAIVGAPEPDPRQRQAVV
jgi:hypothetical protein